MTTPPTVLIGQTGDGVEVEQHHTNDITSIRFHFNRDKLPLHIWHMEITSTAPITSELLRTIPVHKLASNARETVLTLQLPGADPIPATEYQVPEHVKTKWPANPDDELTLHVTATYYIAIATGRPETKHVASMFGVSRATASRIMRYARNHGATLTPTGK